MKKFLAITFIVLLLVPAAVWIAGPDLSMNIHRLGLKFPQPYGQAFLEKEYYRALDQYFNDRFPLRGPLILARNWIDFNIFRTTAAGEVHIGRLGWLYRRNSITDYRQTGDDTIDIERLVLQLHAIEKIVTAANRHFLFIVAPSKTAVYPEFVGWSPDFATGRHCTFDRLLELLERHPLKSLIQLDRVMKAAKKRQVLLYEPTHVYWNGLGASVAADSIHRRVREHLASPVVLDYVSTPDDRIGDLNARIMGFASNYPEIPYQRLPGSVYPYFPSALLYGDGYRHSLIPYLLQMFKQVDVIQADRIPSVQHRENWLAYDCILLAIGQTGLRGLQINLDRIYAALAGRSKYLRRTALDLNAAKPLSRTAVRPLADGVEIKSLGAGSAFVLPDIPASDRSVFRIAKLTFETRQSDYMRFQYDSPRREAVARTIRPGTTDFYVPLPFQKTVSLRILPGKKAGLIHLRSAGLIEFSDPPDPVFQPGNQRMAASPSHAAAKSDDGSLKDGGNETAGESDENRIANVMDRPDHRSMGEVRAGSPAEPAHRGDAGPAAKFPDRLRHQPDDRPDNRLEAEATDGGASKTEAQQRFLIVDAEIELTQEPEAQPLNDDFEEVQPSISESPEILPEYDMPEETLPDFSDVAEHRAEPERMTDAEPLPSNESEDPNDLDPVAEIEPDDSGLTETMNDRAPDMEADLDFTDKPEILPEYETEGSDAAEPSNNPILLSDDVVSEMTDTGSSLPDNSIHLAKVENPAPDLPSITLTDFEDGRIFQRRNHHANVLVAGTFTGSAQTIEARVVGAEDLNEVMPWTVIDDAPQNGIFVGVLPGVPEGGWYRLQARFGSETAVTEMGSHRWGVGILVACLGQSNMKEWFHTGDALQAHAMLRSYSNDGWTEPGSRGNGAIAFGNRLARRLDVPVGLLDFSVNGSGLRKEADWGTGYWEDTAPESIYNKFVAGVAAIGGAVEFVIWFQGEADAARKTVTEAEYRESLTRFIRNQVRMDIANASEREHLPFLIVMMTRRPRGHDEPHQAIRNAQQFVAENEAECYLAATTLDLKNRGKQHMHPTAYTAMGHRVAQTVLYILGKVKYYRGPTATAARLIDDRRIDVSIEHNGGQDFRPASGISGWEILVVEESRSIAKVIRRNSSTISIILENPLTDPATVRYLYGAMPDVRRPVVDDSPLALPLEPYQTWLP